MDENLIDWILTHYIQHILYQTGHSQIQIQTVLNELENWSVHNYCDFESHNEKYDVL